MYYFPNFYPLWSKSRYWIVGIVTSLFFFASVLAHELAHSLVCLRSGIPVKSITLFIFGGVAQITREAARPRTELVMAVAGPLSSLAIAGLFTVVWFLARGVSEPVAALAWWLATINTLLALFNMIPGFPLDGGRVLRSIIWAVTGDYRRSTRIASLTGQGIAYLLIFGGVLIMFRGYLVDGLWLAFIGWFLDNAAVQSYRQAVLRDSLQGFTAQDVMSVDYASLPGDLTIRELVEGHLLRTSRRYFLVTDDGRLSGIVTLHNIRAVPQQLWDTTSIRQAMTPTEKLKVAQPGEDAVSILEQMVEEDINQMPVVREGRVIGMIARDNLLHFIKMRSELRI